MRSNCIAQAIKHKLADPENVSIKVKLPLLSNLITMRELLHFYWHDKKSGRSYHFTATVPLKTIFHCFWFDGEVQRFIH